jgi:hypothetical protein
MKPKKVKVPKLMEKERAALLDPKSKGWKAGTDRLMGELRMRRIKDAQDHHCDERG